MPLTTYTGTADMAVMIPTELLQEFIMTYPYVPRVADAIAWSRPGKGNIPVRYARWNIASVPSGTVAETVDHTDVDISATESSITPGMVRFRMPISDEVVAEAIAGIPGAALAEQLEALMNRLDADALAVSTAATNTFGAVATPFSLAQFRLALQAYRALEVPGSMHALVLHYDALAALENDIAVQSSMWALKKDEDLARSFGGGFQGTLNGVQIFASQNVAAEGAGRSNFMTSMGPGSGLGVVMNELPNVVRTRADEGELRATTFYHFRAWYGTGITNPRRFLEVLSADSTP